MSDNSTLQYYYDKGYRLVDGVLVKGKPGDNKVPPSLPSLQTKGHKYHANKKIVDNVVYDSKREYDFKTMLDVHKIPYVQKQTYVLQEGFKYMGKNIQAIKCVPDFQIHNRSGIVALVDIKGLITRESMVKFKMLKFVLHKQNIEVLIFLPRNKGEMITTIQELLKLL